MKPAPNGRRALRQRLAPRLVFQSAAFAPERNVYGDVVGHKVTRGVTAMHARWPAGDFAHLIAEALYCSGRLSQAVVPHLARLVPKGPERRIFRMVLTRLAGTLMLDELTDSQLSR